MKDTIEVNNYNKGIIFKTLIVFTICSVIVLGAFIVMIVFNINTKYEKITKVEGVVTNIEKDKSNNNVFYITLENGKSYEITSIIGGEISYTKLQEINNKQVTLHLYPFVEKVGVVGIESASFNLTAQEGFKLIKNNNKTGVMVTGIMFGFFALINILLLIAYLKQKKIIVKSVWDLYTFAGYQTPLRKKYIKYTIISMLILFLIGVPSIIYSGSQNDISVAFYTAMGCFIGLFVIWCGVAMGLLPVIRMKDIEYFNNIYDFKQSEISEENIETKFHDYGQSYIFNFTENELTCDVEEMLSRERPMFNEVALAEKQQNPELNEFELMREMESLFIEKAFTKDCKSLCFNYEELKFYTKAIFSPTGAISVFITSNLTDETKKVLESNIILELNESSYYWIKKYNIPVLGLDNFLKNKKQHMIKYCKRKQVAISFGE